MSASDLTDQGFKPEHAEPPILRLGHHAIGLWRAAEEIGDPRLLMALRPLVEMIGRTLAVDVMNTTHDSDIKH